jgi:hypothetical protein
MKNPIEGIDWNLLRKQKLMLINLMNEFSLTYFNDQEREELGEGLINLINSIQDYAVDELSIDENIVFKIENNEE